MKVKEKLAQEFTTLIDSETIDARDSTFKQRATDRAFIAGFEAALKLVLDQGDNLDNMNTKEILAVGEDDAI